MSVKRVRSSWIGPFDLLNQFCSKCFLFSVYCRVVPAVQITVGTVYGVLYHGGIINGVVKGGELC